MMGLVALIASSEQQLQSAAASGARLHSAGFATEMHVKHIDARRSALNREVVNCKKMHAVDAIAQKSCSELQLTLN